MLPWVLLIQEVNMKNNKTMKIVLPILIVLALVGMYFIKNKESLKTSSVNETNVNSIDLLLKLQNHL